MKLDLNACWDQAVRLMGRNREVMLVLAGVFFFLPFFVFRVFVPVPDFAAVAGPSGQNSSALMASFNGFVGQYWWAILILALAQSIGALAVMAVIGDPTRPTVGQAVARGTRLLPSAFAAQMLTSFLSFLLAFLIVMTGALTGSESIAGALAIFVLPVMAWLFTRLSLANPSIAIEGTVNPVAALRRSWRMTAGNGLRLLAFYGLLLLAFLVVSQVIGLVVRVATALPGAEAATIIDALLSGLVTAVLTVLGYAVLASVHRQLARAERTSALDPV